MRAGTLGAVTAAAHRRNPPPPSYTGPLDLTATQAAAAYSAGRALSAAWIGQNVVRLRRDSDDAELDFVAAADGWVDAAAVATWLAGANPFVVTAYDQSGRGGDATQATKAAQPAWTASTANSRPGLSFDGSNDSLTTAGNITFNAACTCFAVCKAVTPSNPSLWGTNNFNDPFANIEFTGSTAVALAAAPYLENDNTHSAFRETVGMDLSSYALTDYAVSTTIKTFFWNGAPQAYIVNNVVGALSDIIGPLTIGDDAASPDDPWSGDIVELILFPSVLPDADCVAIRANDNAAYALY